MMNLLLLLISLADAQPLNPSPLATAAPSSPAEMTPITVDAKTESYLSLRSNSSLDFKTPGPAKIVVNSRRRMAGAAQRSAKATLKAYGDDRLIMTVQVPGISIPSGKINDRMGGFPSKAERVVITVPEEGSVLRLEAPEGGPDFFIQVSRKETPDTFLMPIGTVSGTPAATTKAVPIVEKEETSPPPKPTPQEPIAKAEIKQRKHASASLKPGAGLNMGFGIPARGNKMVFQLAATGRMPIYKKLLSAGGTIGWYKISVEEDVAIADTYGGPLTYSADWHTNVVPIVAHVTAHAPNEFGPVVPIASAGLGLYIATRTDDGEKITSVGVGPEFSAGAEFDIEVGRLQTTISWNEARSRFGNRGPEGEVVRETLAVTRLNISYLYVF
jgi:hypothetical protein